MTLNIIDIRSDLPRVGSEYDLVPTKQSITLHYNGPAVQGYGDPARERQQIQADADFHVGPSRQWNGLQYHYAVLSDGTVLHCRNVEYELYHCANALGNRASISVHMPIGVGQTPIAGHWDVVTDLFRHLAQQHGFFARCVYGHREWPHGNALNAVPTGHVQAKQSLCPGTVLMDLLQQYRVEASAATLTWLRTASPDGTANVRQAPLITSRIATTSANGEVHAYDALVNGWWHRADQLGFVHASILEVTG